MFQVYVVGSDKAIEFYQRAFNAKLLCAYPNDDGTLMHSELDVYGQVLAVSEANTNKPVTGNTMQFCLHLGEGQQPKYTGSTRY
jgi:PhnB protein